MTSKAWDQLLGAISIYECYGVGDRDLEREEWAVKTVRKYLEAKKKDPCAINTLIKLWSGRDALRGDEKLRIKLDYRVQFLYAPMLLLLPKHYTEDAIFYTIDAILGIDSKEDAACYNRSHYQAEYLLPILKHIRPHFIEKGGPDYEFERRWAQNTVLAVHEYFLANANDPRAIENIIKSFNGLKTFESGDLLLIRKGRIFSYSRMTRILTIPHYFDNVQLYSHLNLRRECENPSPAAAQEFRKRTKIALETYFPSKRQK